MADSLKAGDIVRVTPAWTGDKSFIGNTGVVLHTGQDIALEGGGKFHEHAIIRVMVGTTYILEATAEKFAKIPVRAS